MSDTEQLARLRAQLIAAAEALAATLPDAIADAPLNQRATALNGLIDRILKLAAQEPPSGDRVIRIEYEDPDGSIHDTPPWARDDPEE